MRKITFAQAFKLESNPLGDCAYIACGYKRAPRSAAGLALATWSAYSNADFTRQLAWPEMRRKLSLWPDEIIRTALFDTEGGAASLLGFQDQSCLVILRHPTKPTMRPVPWVFTLRSKPGPGARGKVEVRRPHGTKSNEAVFSVQRGNGTWLPIDEKALGRGNRLARDVFEVLRQDTVRIARSAHDAPAPPCPSAECPWNASEPMLDFIPFVSWRLDGYRDAQAVADDLAAWIAMGLSPERAKSIAIIMKMPTPEEDGFDPRIEIRLTTPTGLSIQPGFFKHVKRLTDLLPGEVAKDLTDRIGPMKGLTYSSKVRGYAPQGMPVCHAFADTTASNHHKLELVDRFGRPQFDLEAI